MKKTVAAQLIFDSLPLKKHLFAPKKTVISSKPYKASAVCILCEYVMTTLKGILSENSTKVRIKLVKDGSLGSAAVNKNELLRLCNLIIMHLKESTTKSAGVEWSEVGLEVYTSLLLFFFLALGLMAGFEGCANHGVLFNQGAGSQKWKALDIPGTQPPLSDVAVDLINYNYKYWGKQMLFQTVMFLPLGSFFLELSLIIVCCSCG